ncbi:MAG: hypothetical protein VX335_04040, partial [Pseudomonadota bacterium]|nr:hypothetical protein [Pseudomonadota bacterium]
MSGDSIEHIDKLSDRDILEALLFHPDFDNDRRKFLSLIEANNGFQNILEKYLVDLCDELRDKEYYLKEDHDELLSRVPSIGESYVKGYTDKPFLNIVKPVLNKNLSISYLVRKIFAVPSDAEMKSNFLEDLTEKVTPRLIDIIRKKYVDELCLQQILDFSREILITEDSHDSYSFKDAKVTCVLTDRECLSYLSDSDDDRIYSDTSAH